LVSSSELPNPLRNQLLRQIPEADFAYLRPHLELVSLKRHDHLQQPQARTEYVYFMESGFASAVNNYDRNSPVEIGIIGREGVTGLASILGSTTSPSHTFAQVAGCALRIAPTPLRQAMDRSEALRSVLLRYVLAFMFQMAHTAAANANGSIEKRVARWLLMAQDRLDDDKLPLTHEILSTMLGARRASVTEAVHALATRGLIRAARCDIVIADRKGLIECAGKLYGGPEAEYRRLFG
jgi:CRP-like cAMP-binding protein